MTLTWTIVAAVLSVRVALAVLVRCRMHHLVLMAGLAWFFWPQLTELRSHEAVRSVDPAAVLADLSTIAAEQPALDAEQCSDEEMVDCYSQLRGQYASQMARSLARL